MTDTPLSRLHERLARGAYEAVTKGMESPDPWEAVLTGDLGPQYMTAVDAILRILATDEYAREVVADGMRAVPYDGEALCVSDRKHLAAAGLGALAGKEGK